METNENMYARYHGAAVRRNRAKEGDMIICWFVILHKKQETTNETLGIVCRQVEYEKYCMNAQISEPTDHGGKMIGWTQRYEKVK